MFSARTKQGPHLCPSGTAPPRHPHCPHPWAAASRGEGTPASVLQGDAAWLWAPAGDTKHGRPRKGGEERKPPSGTWRRVPRSHPPSPASTATIWTPASCDEGVVHTSQRRGPTPSCPAGP